MAKLNETAKEYKPTSFMNISECPKIAVDVELFDGEGENSEGKKFTYQFFKIEDTEIRVPKPVLGQLKAQLEANPKLKHFKVNKTGEGLNTTYVVIPLI